IIAPGQFPDGVPSQGFQRTPTLLIDEEYNRYVLAYNAGHDTNESWQKRSYLAIASRPINNLIGDVNEDGFVNVQDVIQIVNMILSSEPHDSADLNDDGNVDILDILQIVNIILGI
ncbi:MAG: hypothetical protein HOG49_24390, partial [Candidatus Scalindua sp.]|nr:hypothetical protein [Candidatus Scalindua sp.]